MNPADELVSIMTNALTSTFTVTGAPMPAGSPYPGLAIPGLPDPPKRLRPRKTASPDAFRLGYWGDHNDEAEALLSSDGVRYYKAEQALLWSIGYPKDNALNVLRHKILMRYADEIAARKFFGTEVSTTK